MNPKLLLFVSILHLCNSTFAQDKKEWVTINGHRTFIRTLGRGEPLLIIHGGPGLNQTYFHPHLNGLSKKNKLVFYDQRASGESAIPSNDSLRFSFLADDIESLRLWLGVEKINILAHSWGALVAVSYAKEYPSRIGKMILSNPVPLSKEYDQAMQKTQQSRFTSSDSTDRSIIMGSPDFKGGKAEAYQRLMMYTFRHSFHNPKNFQSLFLTLPSNFAKATGSLYRGMGADLQAYDWYGDVSGFTFPMLLIHGKHDAIPLASINRIQEQAKLSHLLIFEDSDHFPFIEERKKFIREVATFLNSHIQHE